MSFYTWKSLAVTIMVPAMSLGLLVMSGCNTESDITTTEESHDDHDHDGEHDHDHKGDHDHDHASGDHDHSGWWCNEHGVPEEECALCKTSLIADFKAKGDWCDEHNRPDSQCFIHHPENLAKFAARYEAKYGKQPPKPTE